MQRASQKFWCNCADFFALSRGLSSKPQSCTIALVIYIALGFKPSLAVSVLKALE